MLFDIYSSHISQWFIISTATVVSFSCQNNGGKTENTGDLSLVVCVCEYLENRVKCPTARKLIFMRWRILVLQEMPVWSVIVCIYKCEFNTRWGSLTWFVENWRANMISCFQGRHVCSVADRFAAFWILTEFYIAQWSLIHAVHLSSYNLPLLR